MSDQKETPKAELERFEDLAKKLLKVPKSEVDAEREKEKASARKRPPRNA